MDDLISRQDAIEAFDCTDELIVGGSANAQNVMNYINKVVGKIKALPSVQSKNEERMEKSAQYVPNDDLISRKAAIDALWKERQQLDDYMDECLKKGLAALRAGTKAERNRIEEDIEIIKDLPSAQPTINGYDIRHLELIAAVLQEENLPPERVTEALTDIGGIVAIITKEFEEALRKAVEQCMT